MNLLKPETLLTPAERVNVSRTGYPQKASIVKSAEKAVAALIKSRTQKLQTAILDGFLGVDDTDPARVTRLIRKLIDQKPDVAIRLLTRVLPSLSDADLQKHIPTQQSTITIVNSNVPAPPFSKTSKTPSTQVISRSDVILDVESIEDTDLDSSDLNIEDNI